MKHYTILLLLLITFSSIAQNPTPPSEEDLSKMDFWVGEWNLTWEGGAGTNRIEKKLNDRVIQENFKSTEGKSKGYEGMSVSTYNGMDQSWHQTWVDSQGGHIDMIGIMDGTDRIFQTIAPRKQPDGKSYIFRMRYINITHDAFTWIWERSLNEAGPWEESWKIQYKRV